MNLQNLLPYLPDVTCNNGVSKSAKIKYLYIEQNRVCFDSGVSVPISAEYFKMNLRPLSDLKKLGVDFTTEHSINLALESNFDMSYGVFSYYKGRIDFEIDGDPDLRYDSNKEIPFEVFEYVRTELLKAHYDLLGLIDKGEANDINTLK